jgi:hypothetical protein
MTSGDKEHFPYIICYFSFAICASSCAAFVLEDHKVGLKMTNEK